MLKCQIGYITQRLLTSIEQCEDREQEKELKKTEVKRIFGENKRTYAARKGSIK